MKCRHDQRHHEARKFIAARELLTADQTSEKGIAEQRSRVASRIATYQHLATLRLPKPLQVAVETAIAANAAASNTEE